MSFPGVFVSNTISKKGHPFLFKKKTKRQETVSDPHHSLWRQNYRPLFVTSKQNGTQSDELTGLATRFSGRERVQLFGKTFASNPSFAFEGCLQGPLTTWCRH